MATRALVERKPLPTAMRQIVAAEVRFASFHLGYDATQIADLLAVHYPSIFVDGSAREARNNLVGRIVRGDTYAVSERDKRGRVTPTAASSSTSSTTTNKKGTTVKSTPGKVMAGKRVAAKQAVAAAPATPSASAPARPPTRNHRRLSPHELLEVVYWVADQREHNPRFQQKHIGARMARGTFMRRISQWHQNFGLGGPLNEFEQLTPALLRSIAAAARSYFVSRDAAPAARKGKSKSSSKRSDGDSGSDDDSVD